MNMLISAITATILCHRSDYRWILHNVSIKNVAGM